MWPSLCVALVNQREERTSRTIIQETKSGSGSFATAGLLGMACVTQRIRHNHPPATWVVSALFLHKNTKGCSQRKCKSDCVKAHSCVQVCKYSHVTHTHTSLSANRFQLASCVALSVLFYRFFHPFCSLTVVVVGGGGGGICAPYSVARETTNTPHGKFSAE